MAWLEQIRDNLPPWLFTSIATVIIMAVTGGLAWGIRPALRYLLDRFLAAWSSLVVTAVQILILAGGLALIIMTAGLGALVLLIVGTVAFFAGSAFKRPTLLPNRQHVQPPQDQAYYAVGDTVTLGNGYHGIVTVIDSRSTHLTSAEHGLVILPNSLVASNPIIIPQASREFNVDPLRPISSVEPLPSTKASTKYGRQIVEEPMLQAWARDEPLRNDDAAVSDEAMQSADTMQSDDAMRSDEEEWQPSLQYESSAEFGEVYSPSIEQEPLNIFEQAEENLEQEMTVGEEQTVIGSRPLIIPLSATAPLKRRAELGKQTIATMNVRKRR